MLQSIVVQGKARGLPLASLRLLGPNDDTSLLDSGSALATLHTWRGKVVRAQWGSAPALGQLAALNALLGEAERAMPADPLAARLAKLPPAAQQPVILACVAEMLRKNPDLAARLNLHLTSEDELRGE